MSRINPQLSNQSESRGDVLHKRFVYLGLVRSRSTQSKTKKENKLDLFGFDDGDAPCAEGDLASSGSSNYKIKYFGFDELSESDGDEDEDEGKPRKTMRMAFVPAELSTAASVDVSRPKVSQENSSAGQKPGLKPNTRAHTQVV